MTQLKGCTPWNKGTKGLCKPSSTSFKKGQKPWNYGTAKNKICPVCKKKFKHRYNKCCSIECSKKRISQCQIKSNSMKNKRPWNYIDGRSLSVGPARYGDDWDKIRYLVYRRDRFTCQKCGKHGECLDVHHKIPFLDGGSNELDNLVSLCRKCHREEEARIIKKRIKED